MFILEILKCKYDVFQLVNHKGKKVTLQWGFILERVGNSLYIK
jgi:hypothetical protein